VTRERTTLPNRKVESQCGTRSAGVAVSRLVVSTSVLPSTVRRESRKTGVSGCQDRSKVIDAER